MFPPARSYQDYVVPVDEGALPAGVTCIRTGLTLGAPRSVAPLMGTWIEMRYGCWRCRWC